MARTYRNITDETFFVDLGSGLVKVEPGDVMVVPDDHTNTIQTGETGERAMFELVDTTTKKKPAATASAENKE